MKRVFYIIPLVLILFGTGITLYVTLSSPFTENVLSISSDKELEELKLPGTGKIDDPYVIENTEFGVYQPEIEDYVVLITITGTSKHIIIQNNKFIGGFVAIDIFSVNEGSIRIEDNYFEYKQHHIDNLYFSSFYAMRISNSSNILIKNNDFKESNYEGYIYGIFFSESENLTISNNIISSYYGIYGIDSFSFVIDENFFFETIDVYFERCSYFEVTRNTHNYLFRFKIVYSSFVSLIENTILGFNNSFGFLIYDSLDILIEGNHFDSSIVGVRLIRTSTSKIINNRFEYNKLFAIELFEESSYNKIYGNFFLYNNLRAKESIQAFDSGFSNIWYESMTMLGNYWSNLGKNATYIISGTAKSIDQYPMSI